MMKNLKRLLSMMLALSMVFSLVVPAAATETHEHDHAEEAQQEETINMESVLENITVNAEDVELELDFNNYVVLSDPDFEADMSDPAIITLETELRNITVLDEGTGESIALSEEQVQTILYLYSQYMDNWAANADVLGVQTPFFLSYNDKKDSLGVLGEMLVLAGVSVDKVRTGEYTFQELQGTVELFLYADILGVQYYGSAVEAARDEVMQLIKESGAQTEAQKLLVINDWLAHNNTFDMPYIMNSDKDLDGDGKVSDAEKADEKNKDAMVAPNHVDHEHKQDIYDFIYANYEKNLTDTFKNNIRTGLEAEFKKQYYEGAIKNIIYEGALAEMRQNDEIVGAAKQIVGWDAVYEQKLAEEEKKVYDEAYEQYLKDNHKHEVTVTFNWVEGKKDGITIWTCETATAECSDETCEAELNVAVELKSETTDAKCEETGKTIYTATATVTTPGTEEGESVEVAEKVETKEVVIEALGHNYVEGVCSRCEKTEVCEHEWNNGEVTTAATCGADGVKTFTCTKCAETKTEVIPATEEHVDNLPDDVCDVCGKDIIPVTTECEHEYDEGAVTTAAGCETPGVMTYTCIKCEDSYTEEISATGHAYGEGQVTREATCVTTGVKTFTCGNCNGTKTEEIPVTEHEYDEGVVTTEATCGAAGVKTYTCSVCDGTKTEVIDALEHAYVRNVTVQPTCGTKGEGTDTCANCGDVQMVVIPATENHVDNIPDGVCDVCEQDIPSSGSETPVAISSEAVTLAAEGDDTTPDDNTEPDVDPDADAAAKAAVEAKKEEIEAAAKAAADEETKLNEAIESIVTGPEEDEEPTECEKQAEAAVEQFMTENAEAIAADPVAFVDGMLAEQPEVAAQIHAGWDAFWADAQENGVEVDPVNAPGYKMTVDQIVEQQMDTPQKDDMLMKLDQNGNPILDEEGNPTYMTPNEAIPVYSDMAAAKMTPGVINYWEGSHFGAFGMGTSVCLGYTKAFTYLVQCLHPEIYGKNGANTDMSKAENWKTAQDLYYDAEGNLDINQNYVVDAVRVTFDASVTMYGETEDNFNSDHFWNAVKIDGKWYYADPCYTDVFTEVMMRDRVETDGQMNHLYFIFSHTAAVNMYDGNYKEIKSMYDAVATSTDYEDSWISRIKSNTYFDGGYAYYMYDSTDMLTLMEEYENQNQNSEADFEDPTYKIVRHKLDDTDAGDNGDEDYETLIVFNYKADDDAEAVARVYDPEARETVDNELLTELWHKHAAYAEVYPSIAINAAYYNGKVYFNLANCILSYDVATGAVAMVKEYNTVQGQRDTTKAFGGMAFSVVKSGGDFTVENHPIAGMTIKDDGNMYVSVATNFAFISGKADRCDPASEGHGYEYEESNYNSDYNSYMDYGDYDDDQLASFGYTKEINDNDEFMWTANFVEKLSMSHLDGSSHSYEAVSVAATCGIDAYTENRCTTCGTIEADSRVYDEGTAIEHHFVEWNETYYTKDDAGSWNKGVCYVCTECGYAVTEPKEPTGQMAEQEGAMEEYEEAKAIFDAAKASAGHDYVPTDAEWAEDNSSVTFTTLECSAICPERKPYLDCLRDDNTITITLKEATTFEVTEIENVGICPDGVTKIYKVIAEAEVEGVKYPFTATKAVELEPADCTYVDGICSVCGDSSVKRISGKDRVKTALSVAKALKDTLAVDKFDAVIIATGVNEKFADALAGSYLANMKKAPILLYTNAGLSAETVAFIQENLNENGTVYILGGDSAVPTTVEETLAAYNVVRLSGKTRYETNLAILKEAGITGDEILVATGNNFADSLSASAVGLPLLLVNGKNTSLTAAQSEFLNSVAGKKITIIGGDSAVSEEMKAAIEAVTGVTAERISGKTRHNTSVLIAQKYFDAPEYALLTYAQNFPDGLAGGPLAYALGAPLLLTNAGQEAIANEYIAAEEIESGYVLGGDSAVSDDTACKVFGLEAERVIEKAYYTA